MSSESDPTSEADCIDRGVIDELMGVPQSPAPRPTPSEVPAEAPVGRVTRSLDRPPTPPGARTAGLPPTIGYVLVTVANLGVPFCAFALHRRLGVVAAAFAALGAAFLAAAVAGFLTRSRTRTVGWLSALCGALPCTGMFTVLMGLAAMFGQGSAHSEVGIAFLVMLGSAIGLGGLSMLAHAVGQQLSGRGLSSVETMCQSCGYDLRGIGLSGRCPECGAPFEIVTDAALRRQLQRSEKNLLGDRSVSGLG